MQSPPSKKCKRYFLVEEAKVYFNADFDSGNLEKVDQISPYVYRLYPGFDMQSHCTEKTYFHFKVFGFQMCTVRFHITRQQILGKLLRKGQTNLYNPVYRRGKSPFARIKNNVKIYTNKSDEVQLSFDFEFGMEKEWVEFAFSYPYSYDDQIALIKELSSKYAGHPQIYFYDETLIRTEQKRDVHLLTITEKCNISQQQEEAVDGLFPQAQKRPLKVNKPKVVISGRVHPGETPASYCIQGLLLFLLDQKDYRAYLLRKHFHFIIVPMLNPDGVYHGMFRSDLYGENLNRTYINCTKRRQPTIWGFREYLKYLSSGQDPVIFYFDFHAHPSKKEFFIYGNAFSEITQQIQAETFGKLIEQNCPYFHSIDSIFSPKQMSAKSANDGFSKEGCGRVYAHKTFNIVHSYTVECGYFAPGSLHQLQPVDTRPGLSGTYQYVDMWEKCNNRYYNPESYMLMGKSILITMLDLFHLNPYTRTHMNEHKSISNIRKMMGVKINGAAERFRLIDGNVTKKIRDPTKAIQETYYQPRVGHYGLSVSQNYGFTHPKKTYSLHSRVYEQNSKAHRPSISKNRKRSSSKSKDSKNSRESSSQDSKKLLKQKRINLNIRSNKRLQPSVLANQQREAAKQTRRHKGNIVADLYQLCKQQEEDQSELHHNFQSDRQIRLQNEIMSDNRKTIKTDRMRATSLDNHRYLIEMLAGSSKTIDEKRVEQYKSQAAADIGWKLGKISPFLPKQGIKTEKDSSSLINKYVSGKIREQLDRPPSKTKKVAEFIAKSRFPTIGGSNILKASSNLRPAREK